MSDNLKWFFNPELAVRHVRENPDAYPVRVKDADGETLYFVVGPERMDKIFKATEEAAVWKYIHGEGVTYKSAPETHNE